IEIEPLADEEEAPPWKIKRLMCNINGCTYQTDRRRDMRRHKRSMKHLDYEYCSGDSDSDIDRPPFSCKLCNYTTAKKFCFVRHVRSVRHIRREQAAEEEQKLTHEKAGPPMESLELTESALCTLKERSNMLFSCVLCDYSTTQNSNMARHNKSPEHIQNMQNIADESEFIEFAPLEEDEGVEGVHQTALEESPPISVEIDRELDNYIAVDGGTYECTACDYKTARKFCFVRHVQSRKHLAKLQELEEADPIVQENLSDIIEYAPAEDKISEELLYPPTDDDPGEYAYYIISSND
ncbi:hypothetical protein KR054_002390, partial [Drosophila jambulina]